MYRRFTIRSTTGLGRPEGSRTIAAPNEGLHREAALRLMSADQRYTSCRRALVDAMAAAKRPLTIPEILAAAGTVTVSSAYRNLTILCDAAVARRVSGADDLGRFELAE